MNHYEVVKKLIGSINPIGDSNIDEERLRNLEDMCTLAGNLLLTIDNMIRVNLNDKQASVKACVDYAKDFMSGKVLSIISSID